MDDIAREARMSRPALYQIFKNKTEIFRALSFELMDHALNNAKNGLRAPGSIRDKLFKAIDDSIMELHRFCDLSPHGVELMGINQEIGRDLENAWKLQMITAIAEGIDKAISSGDADAKALAKNNINSTAVARILMHAMEGMRETYLSGQSIDEDVEELINFIAIPLEVSG